MAEMKNHDSVISNFPETEKEHSTLQISYEEEVQKIPSSKSPKKNNKKGRKRGRPSKQSTASLKKKKGANPPWIGRWIKRKKMRKNGKEDAFYIHWRVPNLTCRSKKEVERYEKDGTRPSRKPQKK